MGELEGNEVLVNLSDGHATLRPWRRSDAPFMATASVDDEIRRYNGAHDRRGRPGPELSVEDAERAIDRFSRNW